MADTLYINSDNLLELTLYDNISDLYVNAATVTAQLYDATETAVGTSFSLGYVAGSDGLYQGTLEDATAALMTENCYYTLTITATSGASKLTINRQAVARYDNAN